MGQRLKAYHAKAEPSPTIYSLCPQYVTRSSPLRPEGGSSRRLISNVPASIGLITALGTPTYPVSDAPVGQVPAILGRPRPSPAWLPRLGRACALIILHIYSSQVQLHTCASRVSQVRRVSDVAWRAGSNSVEVPESPSLTYSMTWPLATVCDTGDSTGTFALGTFSARSGHVLGT